MRAMSDDDLAAIRSNLLDDRARRRIETEADRRGVAARLPGVRADLVGLSDDQLAARGRDALAHGTDDVAELAAEAHRRDLLARMLSGGRPADVGDDTPAWVMQYADSDEILRIAAEADRRDPIKLPAPAPTGDPAADLLADRDALAANAAGFTALKEAAGKLNRGDDEDQDERHLITRGEARVLYDEYVERSTSSPSTRSDSCSTRRASPGRLIPGVCPVAPPVSPTPTCRTSCKIRARLAGIRYNLLARIAEAEREGWLGEVEGIQVSLAGAEEKLRQLGHYPGRHRPVDIVTPSRGVIDEPARVGCRIALNSERQQVQRSWGTSLIAQTPSSLVRDDRPQISRRSTGSPLWRVNGSRVGGSTGGGSRRPWHPRNSDSGVRSRTSAGIRQRAGGTLAETAR